MTKTEIEKSIEICISGINGTASEDDGLFILKTLEQMNNEPYHGRGLGIGDTGANEYRSAWGNMITRFVGWKEQINSGLDWKDALLMIFDWADLNEDEMFAHTAKIKNAIFYNHVLKHIIENLVRQSEIEKATAYTLAFHPTHIFKDEDNLYMGYRIIAGYYARRGDADEFFKLFKLCNPSTEKYEMGLLKAELIKGVCRKDGIEAAIKLCRHKNIGDKYYYDALNVYAENGEYARLKEIFAQCPEIRQPEKETELNIMVAACMEAREKGEKTDDDFEELFQRAIEVDPKLKWGDVRLRDSILFDLGWAYKDDKERMIRCRKAIKNNSLKKELA